MDTDYRIGIEMEMLLTPFKEDYDESGGLFDNTPRLCNAVYNAGEDEDKVSTSAPYAEWSVTNDVTIRPYSDGQRPLESVSPVFNYSEQSSWHRDVAQVFATIERKYSIECNQSCGLHVHISPPANNPVWSIKTLKSICRCIFHFEGAIEALVPEHRRGNMWAMNNRCGNSMLRGKSIRACCALVDKCNSAAEIADLMNDDGRRFFSWNFTNLYKGRKATIEFRQAPGATEPKGCTPWVEFVASFVHASKMTSSHHGLIQYARTVQGLHQFITRTDLPGSRRGLLEMLFQGKRGYIVPRALRDLTIEEELLQQTKEREKNEKNLVMEKLEYLISAFNLVES
ncbi:amidoligase enzyme-domain-containing protein [Penicillium angulare]|uniref:amidoligase enzyme-domain-containing protein n=1 Tax=Penicillium angulare TaxID=116970 RepID=UPI0025402172|nr:amidoligase enzyme-domain-containing protein [Penicillium angulare]KAJ5288726.1 amidoligase enzyme-domain-containing protein [Penicillium angulare]